MPYVSKATLDAYKKAKKQVPELESEITALKKSTISKDTYLSTKKSLYEAKTNLTLAEKKVKHYSNLYTGMKGKYTLATQKISDLKKSVDQAESVLASQEAKTKMFQTKYENAIKSASTSRTILTKMKMQHQRHMQQLNASLMAAEKEAYLAKQQTADLLSRIDEIEKNESMAREGSLAQAIVNTRDVVFDNTIAGVQMSETSSRGLSVLAGAAVTAYLITRVS